MLRVVTNLARKAAERTRQDVLTVGRGEDENPFLPYDEELFVADLSDTHVALLNKYNVLDHHLLLVTRAFEEQESLLTRGDFEALAARLIEMRGQVDELQSELNLRREEHKNRMSYLTAQLTEMEANLIATRQLRKRGFAGLISATVYFAEDVEPLKRAGADLVYDYHDGIGVGLAKLSLEQRELSNTAGL